jgi:hypothetical protein
MGGNKMKPLLRLILLVNALVFFGIGGVFAMEGKCSPTKPHFIDSQGVLRMEYCFGADQKVGTADDCGCPSKSACQKDGSCKKSCDDGTFIGECSKKRNLYCDNFQTLIKDDTKCKSSFLGSQLFNTREKLDTKGKRFIFYSIVFFLLLGIIVLVFYLIRRIKLRKKQMFSEVRTNTTDIDKNTAGGQDEKI